MKKKIVKSYTLNFYEEDMELYEQIVKTASKERFVMRSFILNCVKEKIENLESGEK